MSVDKFVVVCGDPVDGFQYYGPFDSENAAVQWAEDCADRVCWWVAPMAPVKERRVMYKRRAVGHPWWAF